MKLWTIGGLFLVTALTIGAQDKAEDRSFFDVQGLDPSIVSFTTEAAAQNLATKRKVVYFFAAQWCELCQADLVQFRQRVKEIPENTTIVLVDFDNADELRTKYGIPLQDVFLQIDHTGRRLALWVGGGLQALKKNLK